MFHDTVVTVTCLLKEQNKPTKRIEKTIRKRKKRFHNTGYRDLLAKRTDQANKMNRKKSEKKRRKIERFHDTVATATDPSVLLWVLLLSSLRLVPLRQPKQCSSNSNRSSVSSVMDRILAPRKRPRCPPRVPAKGN